MSANARGDIKIFIHVYNLSKFKVSANARETAIFLNNDIGADENTKCLYLRLDSLLSRRNHGKLVII